MRGQARRSCILPTKASGLDRVRIEGLFANAAEPSRRGVISLGLAFLGASPLADEAKREAVLPETLRLVNALLAPGALEVIVARIPPTGRGHGIYVKGQSCRPGTTTATGAIDWPPSLLAKLIAHELGHYLGLYHSVEADGSLDQLADTDENNLMYHSPLTVPTAGFSASQFQVMRRHPGTSFDPPR